VIRRCRCKWCGERRNWEIDASGVVRAERHPSPLEDGAHDTDGRSIFHCQRSPSGLCEPSSEADRMVRELAEGAQRRIMGLDRGKRAGVRK